MKSSRRGFGSVEIFLVVLLVLVLIGILIYSTGFVQKKSKDRQRQQIMKELTIALEDYNEKYEHYPIAGDAIPGGAVVASNNNFNSMIAVLNQRQILDAEQLVDPAHGKLFGEFNGVDKLYDGTRFVSKIDICVGEPVVAQVDVTGTVSYAYFSPDGQSYSMCLQNEGGNVTMYTSPKTNKHIL